MLRLHPQRAFLPLLGLALAAPPPPAAAQARRTADKSADVSVFGGFEYAHPDYRPGSNTGGAFGLDFTRYIQRLPIAPSLELRANFNYGSIANERSYVFGLCVMAPFGRLRPYGDFLVGPGTIHFPHSIGYTGDNSVVYNYGGGVDLGLSPNFALKLDLQGQRWNTGTYAFQPVLGLVGLTYTIPFRPYVGHRRQGY